MSRREGLSFSQAMLFLFLFLSQILIRISDGQLYTKPFAGTGYFGYPSPSNTSAASSVMLGVVTDVWGDSNGNIFIVDTANNRVSKIAAGTGIISTVIGVGLGPPTYTTTTVATSTALNWPIALCGDTMGNLYVADQYNHRIRKYTAATGSLTTSIGTSTGGMGADNIAATSSSINQPVGVFVDTTGSIYVAEVGAYRIRRALGSTNIITTVVGNGTSGYNGDNLPGAVTLVKTLGGLVGDTNGNLFYCDRTSFRVRLLQANGIVKTVAGNGLLPGASGDNGPATNGRINNPIDVWIDSLGSLFIAEQNTPRIRLVRGGIITTVVGSGIIGALGDGGFANASTMNSPSGVFVSTIGEVFIADKMNRKIRKVNNQNIMTSFAGTGSIGDNGPATNAIFFTLSGILGDSVSNCLYISEQNGCRIRRVSFTDNIITTFAGNGGCFFSGEGIQATLATVFAPRFLTLDTARNVFFVDSSSSRVRKIDISTNIISTFYGSGYGDFVENATATNAKLKGPIGRLPFTSSFDSLILLILLGIWLDSLGVMYLSDSVISKVIKYSSSANRAVTFAGSGASSYSGDGGPAKVAALKASLGVWGDGTTLFIADSQNNRIRAVSLVTGIITTFAGTGSSSSAGDGRSATLASLSNPTGIYGDGERNIYIADSYSQKVRVVTQINSTFWMMNTLIGTGASTGYNIFTVTPATATNLNSLFGIWVDSNGAVYVAESTYNRIRVTLNLFPTGQPSSQPTTEPSREPSGQPSGQPSQQPFVLPTARPSAQPSSVPSMQPTARPVSSPSSMPSSVPSMQPTMQPTFQPIAQPSSQPSAQPSTQPSRQPSTRPSNKPSICPSGQPTSQPTTQPSSQPTCRPSSSSNRQPSPNASTDPSSQPSSNPSRSPSGKPTSLPSVQPSSQPSSKPSAYASLNPFSKPTSHPSKRPSVLPTTQPSAQPSSRPTTQPASSRFPSRRPSGLPSTQPSFQVSTSLSISPSSKPSCAPSSLPTNQPISLFPSSLPTQHPTSSPSIALNISLPPTVSLSNLPTPLPSESPTFMATSTIPLMQPSFIPSTVPSILQSTLSLTTPPSIFPSPSPTLIPTQLPSFSPSQLPMQLPSQTPTKILSAINNGTLPWSSPFTVNIPDGFVVSNQLRIQLFMFSTLQRRCNIESNISLSFPQSFPVGTNYLVFGREVGQDTNSRIVLDATSRMDYGLGIDRCYRSMEVVRDVNGDGFDDLLLGSPIDSAAYVLFGTSIGLRNLKEGFTIFGESSKDYFGWSLSSAGDFDADGFNDYVICALMRSACYLIYGKEGGYSNLYMGNSQSNAKKLKITGNNAPSTLGIAVSGARDFNGDGFDDIMITERGSTGNNMIYIIYGSRNYLSSLSVLVLTADQGVVVKAPSYSFAGTSLASIGDFNKDGFDDIAISSTPYRAGYGTQQTYIIFGKRGNQSQSNIMGSAEEISLGSLPLENGITIIGGGFMVFGGGDIDLDSFQDLVVANVSTWQSIIGGYITLAPKIGSITRSPALTPSPSPSPSTVLTEAPSTLCPSFQETVAPTSPTIQPTSVPSSRYSARPSTTKPSTTKPSPCPSISKTNNPSVASSYNPSLIPTINPTPRPTLMPSRIPTVKPSRAPSCRPTYNINPTSFPSLSPSVALSQPAYITHIVRGGNYKLNTTHNLRHVIIDSQQLVRVSYSQNTEVRTIYTVMPHNNSIIFINGFVSKGNKGDILDLQAFTSIHSLEYLSYGTFPFKLYLPNNQTIIFVGHNLFDLSSGSVQFSPDSSTKNDDNGDYRTRISSLFDALVSNNVMTTVGILVGLLMGSVLLFNASYRFPRGHDKRRELKGVPSNEKFDEQVAIPLIVREQVSRFLSEVDDKSEDEGDVDSLEISSESEIYDDETDKTLSAKIRQYNSNSSNEEEESEDDTSENLSDWSENGRVI